MTARRLLMAAGSGGVFTPPLPTAYSMLYNGSTGAGEYDLGLATSTDNGVTWTAYAGNPVLSRGSSGAWDDEWAVQCSLARVGSTWVVWYTGYSGSVRRIGRATSPDLITWTKDAGNPIIPLGAGGAFDHDHVSFPTVVYDPALVHPYQMWYTGWLGGVTTVGYAYSTDGIAWTKGGKVLDVGAGGAFDDAGLVPGPVLVEGGTYHVYYGGFDGAQYHSGYATTTDPTDAGSYTKQGVLAGFSGAMTVGGVSYLANHLRALVRRGPIYLAYLSLFHPVSADGTEAMGYTTASDHSTFAVPLSGPLIALGSGWDSNSAENASVVATV